MQETRTTFTLRPGRADDWPALLDLYAAAYAAQPEYGEADEAHARRYLRWLQRHHTFFQVAEDEAGRRVGFIVVDADWRDRQGRPVGEIHELVVHPAHWGHGLGGQLLEAGLAHIRARGLRRAGLWVGEKNDRARAFYERHGFRAVGQGGFWVRMEKSW